MHLRATVRSELVSVLHTHAHTHLKLDVLVWVTYKAGKALDEASQPSS